VREEIHSMDIELLHPPSTKFEDIPTGIYFCRPPKFAGLAGAGVEESISCLWWAWERES